MDPGILIKLDQGPKRMPRKSTGYRFVPPAGKWNQFVLHRHYTLRNKRVHWDLRIEVPAAGGLRSFAIPKARLPKKGERLLFIETNIHPDFFLTFEKDIPPGSYGAGSIKIVDTGKYYTHRAREDLIVGKYKKALKPRMKKQTIEVMAAMPKKSPAAVAQIFRHWKQKEDPKWLEAEKAYPEFETIQRSWRKLVHDFWSHQDQYSKTFKSVQRSARKGIWREDDLYMLKQEFFDLRMPAGQLVLHVKRWIEKEAKIGLKIVKDLKMRSHPKNRIYRQMSRMTRAHIWRLLVVLMFDQPHLLGEYDQLAVGREWEDIWSKMGILGKGGGPR